MNVGGIFLDRDGTINEEVNFLSNPADLRIIPGAAEAIREANQLGFKVFVVTNQSGIGRGLLTEEDLSRIHSALIEQLHAHDARIDAIYYCPHAPAEGDSQAPACECRKPRTGLVDRARREFSIDAGRSYVIGDRMIDMQLAANAGMTPILVLTGYGKAELELCRRSNVRVDHVASDLLEAMHYVKRTVPKEHLSIP